MSGSAAAASSESSSGLISVRCGEPLVAAADDTRRLTAVVEDFGFDAISNEILDTDGELRAGSASVCALSVTGLERFLEEQG
jgi:hypothetical protein